MLHYISLKQTNENKTGNKSQSFCVHVQCKDSKEFSRYKRKGNAQKIKIDYMKYWNGEEGEFQFFSKVLFNTGSIQLASV